MYEPEEYEPQEHDELAAKVYGMIQEELKTQMQDTIDGLEHQTKRNGELQSKIHEMQRTIRDVEMETQKKLREKENDVRRQLFDGFTIGDSAFYPKHKYSSIPCDTCNQKGKLAVTIGEENLSINCPKCQGFGKKSFTIYEPQKDKIGSVHYEMNDRNRWLSFYLEKEDSKRESKTVFKTLEECQSYCDEKNKPKEE